MAFEVAEKEALVTKMSMTRVMMMMSMNIMMNQSRTVQNQQIASGCCYLGMRLQEQQRRPLRIYKVLYLLLCFSRPRSFVVTKPNGCTTGSSCQSVTLFSTRQQKHATTDTKSNTITTTTCKAILRQNWQLVAKEKKALERRHKFNADRSLK